MKERAGYCTQRGATILCLLHLALSLSSSQNERINSIDSLSDTHSSISLVQGLVDHAPPVYPLSRVRIRSCVALVLCLSLISIFLVLNSPLLVSFLSHRSQASLSLPGFLFPFLSCPPPFSTERTFRDEHLKQRHIPHRLAKEGRILRRFRAQVNVRHQYLHLPPVWVGARDVLHHIELRRQGPRGICACLKE